MKHDKPAIDVSVVIIHTGGYEHLQGCLTSLFSSVTELSIEVLVVDNRSGTPGLAELVAAHPAARIVPVEKRMGYPAATNRGIAESSGRHILWCNDDLVFHSGMVERLAAYLDTHADYGAAGPRMLNPDGTFQPCFSLVHLSLFNLVIERLNLATVLPAAWSPNLSSIGHENEERDIASAGGACMMIRRSALESIGGGIDERFFLYTEEFDLSYRLHRAGWKIRYVPSATVVHLASQTTVANVVKVPSHFRWVVQGWRSRFAYLHKHAGGAAETVYAAVFAITAVPRWVGAELLAAAATMRGDRVLSEGWRTRARLHAFAARMALSRNRHDASEYPVYPAG